MNTGSTLILGYAPVPPTPTPSNTPTITNTPTLTPTPTFTPTPFTDPLIVTTNGDGPVAACSGLNCTTLRDAIAFADTNPGEDEITFDGGVTGVITLTEGELDVNDDVVITGPGSATLAVSGDDASRVFNIASSKFGLEGVTVQGRRGGQWRGHQSAGRNTV